jgi:TolB-like protein/predicted Zn-dependent protease
VQWALAYIAAAFALLQGIDIVANRFDWPQQAIRLFILAMIVGFLVTLVLAWYHGERGAQRVSGTELLILALLLAIGGGLLWRFADAAHESALNTATSPPASASPLDAPPASQVTEKSIAVLPFENLSRDPDNAFFAEGMRDEILTRLSKIAALKVISRTSTMKYKSAPENLREIGQQLGVAHILEGSVQRSANSVHVNVQLIRAKTDEHLWAESYTRTLDDVFAVEAEVATAIAAQLNANLSGTEQKAITERPTQNTAAYEAYLRAVTLDLSFVSIPRLQQAVREYEEAVRLDPNFGVAWARLARARSTLRFFGRDLEANTLATIREEADRAMALAPDAGETWVALGGCRSIAGDPVGAVAAYQEAQKRMPGNAQVYQYLAFGERRIGRWREAEASFNKGLELDPRSVQVLSGMSEFYNALRRHDEAISLVDRAIALAPELESSRAYKASYLRSAGRLSEAATELSRIPPESIDTSVLDARVQQALYERQPDVASRIAALLWALPRRERNVREKGILIGCGYCLLDGGRADEAMRIFRRISDETSEDDPQILQELASAHAGLGEKDQAIELAQRAIAAAGDVITDRTEAGIALAMIQARLGEKEAALASLPRLLEVPYGIAVADLKFNPAWDSLRDDPGFQKLLATPTHIGAP